MVCFWQPEKAIKAGDTLAFNYRLYWSAQPPVQSPLARVMATRTGMGGFPEGWAPGEHYPDKWARRFAIDFVGGDLKAAAPKGIEPVITLSSGEAKQVEILYVEPFDGYRIQFDWYPTSDSTAPVDMRMFLRCRGGRLSAKPGCISISRPRRISAVMSTIVSCVSQFAFCTATKAVQVAEIAMT